MDSAPNRQGIGFITVRKHPEHGYFGGLLVVNVVGRPLEFHCSLPFKPTKSQAILYGPTLDEFVCGEQIARALVTKAKAKLDILLTDASAVLAVRNVSNEPIVYIDVAGDPDSTLTRPAISGERLEAFPLLDNQVRLLSEYFGDEARVRRLWSEHPPQFELTEPFGRISEALLEAHPSAKAA